jgi:hypothetical protein
MAAKVVEVSIPSAPAMLVVVSVMEQMHQCMQMLEIGGLGRRREFKRRQLGYPRYRSLLHVVRSMFVTFVKLCGVSSITDCPHKPAFDGGRLVQDRETPKSLRISFVALVK